jgi:curli biogenesis system outer membrane secretion channel CsgG
LAPQIWPVVVLALSLAVAPVHARAAEPAPVKIAVFDFELEDSTPSAALLSKPTSSAAAMDKVSNAAREELAKSGHFVVIDASKADAQPVAQKTLRDCDGCEAGIAQQLGAQQSLIGVLSKVTQTDYYVVIRIRDARTGKILDQQEANFAGDEQGWATGVRMLIRHQVLGP